MRFCRHQHYIVIDDIQSPKWSTDEILINKRKISNKVEHYLIRFSDKSPKDKYGWFYLAGKDIRKCKTQPNGKGEVYVVPMKRRQPWNPIKDCNCENMELDPLW